MIPYGKHHIDEDDIQAVVQVLRSDYLTQGPIIEEFERLESLWLLESFNSSTSDRSFNN
jgi:dTDP-4-amino-4,6-dideoxygalactose transaminase